MLEQSSLWPAHGAEEWRPVVGFEGRYEVSDIGRIRSLQKMSGRRKRIVRADPLVLHPSRTHGYLRLTIGGSNRSVHRLVLEAFVGPCPDGHQGAHLNGDRTDNRSENLAWKTPPDNGHDKVRHGTAVAGDRHWSRQHPERRARGERNGAHTHPEQVLRGERNGNSRLTATDVVAIRAALARGETLSAIGLRFGVTHSIIGRIRQGKIWTHVGAEAPE